MKIIAYLILFLSTNSILFACETTILHTCACKQKAYMIPHSYLAEKLTPFFKNIKSNDPQTIILSWKENTLTLCCTEITNYTYELVLYTPDKKAIGYATYRIIPCENSFLDTLWIEPTMRRQNGGSLLFSIVTLHTKTYMCNELIWTSGKLPHKNNISSQERSSFYIAQGAYQSKTMPEFFKLSLQKSKL